MQRFYPALEPFSTPSARAESPGMNRAPLLTTQSPALVGPQADFAIPAFIGAHAGLPEKLASAGAALVMAQIAAKAPGFAGVTYQKLAEVKEQWPIVGRGDLYYGGTTYENSQGLGVQLPLARAKTGDTPVLAWPVVSDFKPPKLGMTAFPITRLYDQGTTLSPSEILQARIGEPYVVLNAGDAARMKIQSGAMVRLVIAATQSSYVVRAALDETLPERILLAPRSFGIPITAPTQVEVRAA